MTQSPPARPEAADEDVQEAFERAVADGRIRLGRSWPALLSTGFVGGLDIGAGLLALLVIEHETGSRLLGALGFAIGFLALALGRSELFTENFLVPVTAVVARDARVSSLLRLWGATLGTNLVAGWAVTAVIIAAAPELGPVAVETGRHYVELPAGQAFALAIIGGGAITLMTWMERGSDSEFGRLLAVVAIAFLLAAVPLNHVIVVSLALFAALHAGAPFGYPDWLALAAIGAAGNMVGGLVFVTTLRLVQVGGERIAQERRGDVPPEADAS